MVEQRYRIRLIRLTLFGLIAIIGVGLMGIVSWRQSLARQRAVASAAELSATEAIARVDRLQGSEDTRPLDAVLQMATAALEHMQQEVSDYTAILEKQERVDGELGEIQRIELKVMTPRDERLPARDKLHAYFRFLEPSRIKGREVIWVEGGNSNKLVAHEAGLMNVMRVKLDPEGPLAMLGNKYPASTVGLETLLRKLIETGLRDRDVPTVQVTIEDITFEAVKAKRIVVVHPEPLPDVDFHRAEIVMDPQRQVPLSFTSHLWPSTPGAEPPLEERYVYHDLRLNVGLTAEDFNPDNPTYDFP